MALFEQKKIYMSKNNNNDEVVEALCHAFEMEVEKVENYLAASVNLDGLRATSLRVILEREVEDELEHARRLADRIKVLGGTVPGSMQMKRAQRLLQPPADSTDIVSVIRGILAVEEASIEHYNHIIELTEGRDHPTQALAIELLADEEQHHRNFAGFLWGLHPEGANSQSPGKDLDFEHSKVA